MIDEDFALKTLRRFATGKKIPAAQLQHLEDNGFICATDDGTHHLTAHGALTLKEGHL
ncbi:hypothetical protein [Corynebacterium riegelii]|uniref:hypothetical protein n=1 Tax=Corynebacterium riegelii TaxID=156976 RepID=UPI002888FB5F|nr:hypothetical protein [Corynebacterium riegelii]